MASPAHNLTKEPFMSNITFKSIFFIILACVTSSLKASDTTRQDTLFAHISDSFARSDYFRALTQIRNGENIFAEFFSTYPLSDFHFRAETKQWFEANNAGKGEWKKGVPIQVPFWVEATTRRNWRALQQLLHHRPEIITEAYNDAPFCTVVFEAGPPASIVQHIIDIATPLDPASNPFLGIEKNPERMPFSSLHLETPLDAVALCMLESDRAARGYLREDLVPENSARLCARHIAGNTHSPLITVPDTKKCEHLRATLLHLIAEEKYHGFDRYFALLAFHNISFEDFVYLTSAGLTRLAKTGTTNATFPAKKLLSAALQYCPHQENQALFDFTCFVRDEYLLDPVINKVSLPAQTVLTVIEKQQREFIPTY